MSTSTKVWIVVISIMVIAISGSFLTNGYGLFKTKTAPTPAVAAAPVIDQTVIDAAVSAELDRRDQAALAAAKKMAKAKADSIAQVKAERKARELEALPAEVRKLRKELAALKATKAAPAEEINIAPALAAAAQKKAAVNANTLEIITPSASSNMNATAKTFEYKLEASDPATKKIGVTLNGWTEYKPGATVYLSPGIYGFNAENSGATWAYDSNSLRMGKPNFLVFVGGLKLDTPGSDNKRQGANAMVRVNDDGTLTLLE